MSEIFISYKREERQQAKQLADALEQHGWSVWWDPKLRAGERFDSVIEQALNNARCVIVVWSQLSVVSEYVKDEATYALNQDKLLPVTIDAVDLPFRFQGLHTIKLQGWDGSASSSEIQALLQDLADVFGSPSIATRDGHRPHAAFAESTGEGAVSSTAFGGEAERAAGEPQTDRTHTQAAQVSNGTTSQRRRDAADIASEIPRAENGLAVAIAVTVLGWVLGWTLGWGLGGAMGWDSGSTGDWNIGGGTAGAVAGGIGWVATRHALRRVRAYPAEAVSNNILFGWIIGGFIGGAIGWAIGWTIAGAIGGSVAAYYLAPTRTRRGIGLVLAFVVAWALAWAIAGVLGWDIGFEAARAFGWGKSRALGWALGGAAGGVMVGMAAAVWLWWWARRPSA